MRPAPALRSLDVIVTSDCNLRCAYCYQNAKAPGVIPWRALCPSLDLLLASPRRSVTVLFIGGEPLLGFPVVRRAVRYVEDHRRPGLAVEYAIATNGTLVRRAEADFFAKHDFDLQISLDGTGNSQPLRGADTERVVESVIERLRRWHPGYFARRLSVASTLLARTVSTLSDSFDHLLSIGVPEVVMVPALTHQPDWHADRVQELRHQCSRVFASSLRYYRRTGLVPLTLFRRRQSATRARFQSTWLCGCGRGEALAVDVDGGLSGCVLFARSYQRFPDTSLGRSVAGLGLGAADSPGLVRNLRAYERRVQHSGVFDRREDKYSSYDSCAACQYRFECRVCPICIVSQAGNEDPHRVPDFVCAFNRVVAHYRRRFPALPDLPSLTGAPARVPPLVRELLAFAARTSHASGARALSTS